MRTMKTDLTFSVTPSNRRSVVGETMVLVPGTATIPCFLSPHCKQDLYRMPEYNDGHLPDDLCQCPHQAVHLDRLLRLQEVFPKQGLYFESSRGKGAA